MSWLDILSYHWFSLYAVFKVHILTSSRSQVENTRVELVTSCLQGRRSPNWANPPWSGSHLSSRAVSSQVLWAEASLTSVFGMGTGGPPASSTPTIIRQLSNCFAIIAFCFLNCNPFLKNFSYFFKTLENPQYIRVFSAFFYMIWPFWGNLFLRFDFIQKKM